MTIEVPQDVIEKITNLGFSEYVTTRMITEYAEAIRDELRRAQKDKVKAIYDSVLDALPELKNHSVSSLTIEMIPVSEEASEYRQEIFDEIIHFLTDLDEFATDAVKAKQGVDISL